MSEKVREFFICYYDGLEGISPPHVYQQPLEGYELDYYHTIINVIEKSAYDKLAEVNKVLVEALERAEFDLNMAIESKTGINVVSARLVREALAKAKEMGNE